MSTLANRPNTALLVIDVQNGVVAQAYDRDDVVANIARLVDKARAAGVAVIWMQHNSDVLLRGSESWQYVAELVRLDAEPLVQKAYDDAFEETDLESVLAARGIGRLVVAGAQSDGCIRSTLHGAFVRGYDVTLVGDAHTTEDLSSYGAPPPDKVIAHTNLYWQYHTAPGRTAGTVSTADVDFVAWQGPKADLHRQLGSAREALVWKLDGLSEYDIRRPVVPTGTNLLGLVKHLACVEFGYFGDTFGRNHGERLPDVDADPSCDLWARSDESREDILGMYRRAWAHSDATIQALPLDAIGHVPWWDEGRREVTLHRVLADMVAETNRHAGHADIVRELIDGSVGHSLGNDNLVTDDPARWAEYREMLERIARQAD